MREFFRRVTKIFRRSAAPLTSAQKVKQGAAPVDCPCCSSRIVLRDDAYVCVGLTSREEVERYLLPRLPASMQGSLSKVISIPSCGWSGRAAEFGKTWG